MTNGTLCHAICHFVFWYHHVTYRTSSNASRHLVTASATDLRERFLLLVVFYLTLLPAGFKASLGASSSTSKLAGTHADLQNIAPARLFICLTTIHKRDMVVGPIYGFWQAGWLRKESAPHGIRTLFTTSRVC